MNDNTDLRLAALERLAVSRERMRQSLSEASAQAQAEADAPPSALMSALLAIPGASVVIDAVRHWWAHHPMHFAGTVATHASRTLLGPMARRKPFTLVLVAMAAGGLLVWLKPWRGILKPALLAGLMPQIISRAVAHVPMESWLSALTQMTRQAPSPDAGASASHTRAAAPQAPQAPQASSPATTPAPAARDTSPTAPSSPTLH
ncbi:MAG: hypothetical protein KF891_09235 [Rhizobacter sp.]|nr:hypothetical protein [Rhizobacter sp.]